MTTATAFGPQGPNYTITRPPADPKASAGVDTFFKNCSAAGAKDGTFATADFFNVLVANLRYLCRTSGVALDDADDTMVFQAIRAIGKPFYAADTGTKNNIVVALPGVSALTEGMTVFVKAAFTNDNYVTINANSLGAIHAVHTDASQLSAGDVVGGGIALLVFDGVVWQYLWSARERAPLSQNVSIYVNPTTGSDSSYNGSAATISGVNGPFQTLTKALDYVAQFAPGTYGVTINLAAGTYNGGSTGFPTAPWAHCPVTINGAGVTSIITSSGSAARSLGISGSNNYTLQNFGVSSTSTYAGGPGCIGFDGGARVTLNGGITVLGMSGTSGAVFYGGQGQLSVQGTLTISGSVGSSCIFTASGSGSIISFGSLTATTITISTGITTLHFVEAANGGYIAVSSVSPPTFVNPGNVTGMKYYASLNGVINTWGQGINYFPGTVAGGTASGGQYS